MKQLAGAILVAVCPWLYAFSMILPAVNAPPRWPAAYGQSGWWAFQRGFAGLDTPGQWNLVTVLLAIAWLANLVLWVGLCCAAARRWREAALCGVVGVGFCLHALWFWNGAAVGYWLWVASAVALSSGSSLLAWRTRPASPGAAGRFTVPEHCEKKLEMPRLEQGQSVRPVFGCEVVGDPGQ
jgi:hypothetical protein